VEGVKKFAGTLTLGPTDVHMSVIRWTEMHEWGLVGHREKSSPCKSLPATADMCGRPSDKVLNTVRLRVRVVERSDSQVADRKAKIFQNYGSIVLLYVTRIGKHKD
jgi:hypothetical protein